MSLVRIQYRPPDILGLFQGKEAFLIISINELNQEIIYSYCKMKPADNRINNGGFEAGIGIGYEF